MPDRDRPYLGRGNVTPYARREIALRLVWSAVQATLFRWSPRGFHGWRILLLRIFGASIPSPATTRIYPTAQVTFPWRLTLEPHSLVGPHVRLYNLGPITVSYGAQLSQYVHLCAGTHDYRRWAMPMVTLPIVIGPNAWLGADVFVGPGVIIGELCVVGARAVVVADLPPRKICVGQPCRPVKDRPEPV